MSNIIDYRKKDIRISVSDFDIATAQSEFPYIHLVEWKQKYSDILGTIVNFTNNVMSANQNINNNMTYKGLYFGEPTKNEYYLPYFSDFHHNINQGWQESRGAFQDFFKSYINEPIAGVQKMVYPAAGAIAPKSYTGPGVNTYTFEFDLINTAGRPVANDGYIDIINNKNFLEQFIKANLHAIYSSLVVEPPCLYEVLIPGIRWSPVAVVSDLRIVSKGTMNILNVNSLTKNYIYPDAWGVTVTIQELIEETKSIYNEAINGKTNSSDSGSKITVKVFENESSTTQL